LTLSRLAGSPESSARGWCATPRLSCPGSIGPIRRTRWPGRAFSARP